MMTGDVVEQRAERVLVWIDRKKNIMKLSQVSFIHGAHALCIKGSSRMREGSHFLGLFYVEVFLKTSLSEMTARRTS